ncbi:hypothetical protein MU582_06705 [Nocardioidaceae bacterium SCSIO 66511]|nr:hypothetical protein MU582_06705 [Nocardioidaceae bacterium SCSIO 66511]
MADQLGHAASMTQDVYLGRKAANPRAAEDVERFMASTPGDEESSPEDENHG